MTIHVNIGDAKTRLSQLIAAALRGEKVVLSKAGDPQVELVPVDSGKADSALREQRLAWMGSMASAFPDNAGDLFLEPGFTDDEIDEFDIEPNVDP